MALTYSQTVKGIGLEINCNFAKRSAAKAAGTKKKPCFAAELFSNAH